MSKKTSNTIEQRWLKERFRKRDTIDLDNHSWERLFMGGANPDGVLRWKTTKASKRKRRKK